MKKINLKSLVQASKNLRESTLKQYLNYLETVPKAVEFICLDSLVAEIEKHTRDTGLFDEYFFGYTIPQISKEFDLLRFGEDDIINIELKSESTEEEITKQLLRNRYYLSFINCKIYSFTYVLNTNKLYTLNEDNNLIETDFKYLTEILENQRVKEILVLDKIFNPSNYLVSPFNSTKEFIERKYFLTTHQELIKKESIILIDSNETTFISITGNAGTGKTLLTYDLAKEYVENDKKVLIIHCGILNDGHISLRDDYGWDIIPAKLLVSLITNKKISKYDLIVVDETQRMYPGQLDLLINDLKESNGNCIFSYDGKQCLHTQEIKNNIEKHIFDKTNSKVFSLKKKIRTNKEIASFIVSLFNKSRPIEKLDRSNITLNYFDNYNDTKKYLELLKEQSWKIINFTQSRKDSYPYDYYIISSSDNVHGVIGQEFDKVVAVIDSTFYYKDNLLSTRGYKTRPYYHPTKMLFQILTRTRKELNVIVINNNELMERTLEILEQR
jgi:hypothetical protein